MQIRRCGDHSSDGLSGLLLHRGAAWSRHRVEESRERSSGGGNHPLRQSWTRFRTQAKRSPAWRLKNGLPQCYRLMHKDRIQILLIKNAGFFISFAFWFLNAWPGGLPQSRRRKKMKGGLSSHQAGLRTAGCTRWNRWPGVGPWAAAGWPRRCRRGRRNFPAAGCPTGGRSCAVGTRLCAAKYKIKNAFLRLEDLNMVNIYILEWLRKTHLN